MEEGACNLCGAPPERHRRRFVRDGEEIVRCERCGLLFRRRPPTRAELSAAYSPEYWRRDPGDTSGQGYRDYVAEEDLHRANARRRLDRLEAIAVAAPGRVLDVGCAAGYFLDEARRRGWECEGVELSPEMADRARAELGLPVRREFFQDADVEVSGFDLVTMWDYIEHSPDPAGDVAKARAALRPGGTLAISTGDASSLVARLSGSRWHLLTPRHHLYFFSRSTLGALLRRDGFEVVYEGHPGAVYTLGYATHKLRTARPSSRALQALARWGDSGRASALRAPLNLRDIVTVVARAP